MDAHSKELLHHDAHLGVNLQRRLVSDNQGPEKLEARNFDREIEGTDHGYSAVGEPVPRGSLAQMVTGDLESLGEKSHVIAGEILEKFSCDNHLRRSLREAFRNYLSSG